MMPTTEHRRVQLPYLYIMAKQPLKNKGPQKKGADLLRFVGKVKIEGDPVEMQREMRRDRVNFGLPSDRSSKKE